MLYIRAIHHHGMLGDLNTSGITLQVKNFLGHGKGSTLVRYILQSKHHPAHVEPIVSLILAFLQVSYSVK